MKTSCLLFVALTFAIPAVAADMYSWTDANGVKHFSDSPPPANVSHAQKLKVKGGVTSSDESAAPAKDEAKGGGPALAAAAGYAPEDIKRNCEIARKNLALLDERKPAADLNGKGPSAEALKTHQDKVDRTNGQIKLFCTN